MSCEISRLEGPAALTCDPVNPSWGVSLEEPAGRGEETACPEVAIGASAKLMGGARWSQLLRQILQPGREAESAGNARALLPGKLSSSVCQKQKRSVTKTCVLLHVHYLSHLNFTAKGKLGNAEL